MTNLDRQAFADRIEGDPNYSEQLHEDPGLPDPLPDARNRTYKLCDGVGILSLSETPGNLLMWGHYAEEHTRFVLMFDDSHDSFKGNDSIRGFAAPARVQCSSNRPRTTIEEVSELELFFIKGSHWEYEKEWRYLKFRRDADKRIDKPNTPSVSLFRLPPKCVIGVILGCRRLENLQGKISILRREDAEFGHLRSQQARASKSHYRLWIDEVES